jgi:bleomycin hydrolase
LPSNAKEKEGLWKRRIEESSLSQSVRQEEFDRFLTTDDHLMHITGMAKDNFGTMYFITKNSWGEGNPYRGYQYVSEAYAAMKTVGILIHKDALPQDIRKKLGL